MGSGSHTLVKKLKRTDTKTIINVMSEWFNMLGWPRSMRSDGGPQFRGELTEFCNENKIIHELASAYNPKSNGLAEAAVKNVKLLMEKCFRAGECLDSALYIWKNTPRVDGKSPVQLLFGRRQLTSLPTLPQHHAAVDLQEAAANKDKVFENCLLYTSPSPRDS